jgi:hypothetical protein
MLIKKTTPPTLVSKIRPKKKHMPMMFAVLEVITSYGIFRMGTGGMGSVKSITAILHDFSD